MHCHESHQEQISGPSQCGSHRNYGAKVNFPFFVVYLRFSIPPQNLINTDYSYKGGKTGFDDFLDFEETCESLRNAVLKNNTHPY